MCWLFMYALKYIFSQTTIVWYIVLTDSLEQGISFLTDSGENNFYCQT